MTASQQPASSTTHVILHTAPVSHRGAARAAWVVIIIACVLSAIPLLGFVAWFVSAPLLLAALILSIIVLARGGTLSGIVLLLVTLIAAPIFILCAPFLASFLGIAGAGVAVGH